MTTLRVKTGHKSPITLSPRNYNMTNNIKARKQNLTNHFSKITLTCNKDPFRNGWTTWRPPKNKHRHFPYTNASKDCLGKRKKSNTKNVKRNSKRYCE